MMSFFSLSNFTITQPVFLLIKKVNGSLNSSEKVSETNAESPNRQQ